MPVVFGLLLGTLALSHPGCTGGPPGRTQDSVSQPASVTATAPDSLHVRLDMPAEVPIGRPVPIVIRLENEGERPLDLYLRGRTIAFDIFISRADGQPVWQRLKDEVIPAIVQLKTLRPGEVLELRDEWDQRGNGGELVGPGAYVVRGTVLTDGARPLETASASLRIVRN